MALNANTVLINTHQVGGRATLRFNGTSANVFIVANSTVNSDLSQANSTLDPVSDGAKITGIWWSLTGNTAAIARANSSVTTNVVILSGTGDWCSEKGWKGDYQLPTQNVVVTFGTSAVGTIYVEFAKSKTT